jgi:hypothetical protein
MRAVEKRLRRWFSDQEVRCISYGLVPDWGGVWAHGCKTIRIPGPWQARKDGPLQRLLGGPLHGTVPCKASLAGPCTVPCNRKPRTVTAVVLPPLDGPSGRALWTVSLDGLSGRALWTGPLHGSSGWSLWTAPLDPSRQSL